MKYDIVLIEYLAGTGGQHMANMLRLSEKVAPCGHTGVISDYKEKICDFYENKLVKNAHFQNFVAMNILDGFYNSIVLPEKTTVVLTHREHTADIIKTFNQYTIGKIAFVSNSDGHIKRNIYPHPTDRRGGYAPAGSWELKINDAPFPYLSDCDLITTVETLTWCSSHGVNELAKIDKLLALSLDLQLCDKLHKAWVNKIFSKVVG